MTALDPEAEAVLSVLEGPCRGCGTTFPYAPARRWPDGTRVWRPRVGPIHEENGSWCQLAAAVRSHQDPRLAAEARRNTGALAPQPSGRTATP